MVPQRLASVVRFSRHLTTSSQTRTLSRRDPKSPDEKSFLPQQDIVVDQLLRGNAIAEKLSIRVPDTAPPEQDRWERPVKTPLFAIGRPGGVREYVFNREQSGNLLDLQAVRWLDSRVWMAWRMPEITAVVLRGTGDYLFSRGMPLSLPIAGGAVPNPVAVTLLQEFYQLVYLCSRTHKLIGILNGRCGGNSTSLIQHSPYRFATATSQFSLPQTAQGFFPDAGLTHFLSRLENKVGIYLALTGATLTGPDLVHSGIANLYLASDGKDQLMDLMESNHGHHASMREYVCMVNEHGWMEEPFSLEAHLETIERCFSHPSVESIIDSLRAESSSWAKTTLDQLLKKCPLSLKVTLHALQQGPQLPLEEALKNDFRVARGLMSTPEYLNGVRAFAARDSSYRWPRTLRDIRDSDIKALFDSDPKRPDLKLPFEDYHDPYEINWSLEARKRYKQSQSEKGFLPHLPNILDDIERS